MVTDVAALAQSRLPLYRREFAMTETEDRPLVGRTVVVAGATGGIGEGVTLALLRQGARVVAAGRSASSLERLAEYAHGVGPGALVTELVDVGGPDTDAVRRTLAPYGALDGAVVTIGNAGPRGRTGLQETSDQAYAEMIEDNLTSHFHALRSLTPLLSRKGALVHLSGYSAEIPFPFAALMAATNAAKKSLVRSLAAELDGNGPRVYELVIGPIRTRPRAAIGADSPGWYSAEDLGHHAGLLIAGDGTYADVSLQYLLDHAHGVQVKSSSA